MRPVQVLAELGQSKAVAFDQIDKVSCTGMLPLKLTLHMHSAQLLRLKLH